jgi:molybdopterin-binding protein
MLSIRNIAKNFGEFALRDISFEVAEGEYFVLLGPSGAGKTALLEMIAGLQTPDSGSIHLNNRDITREMIQRRRLALVYQDRALFPHMTVRRNVAYGLHAKGVRGTAAEERVSRLAVDVGIQGLLDRQPCALSGGEAQRVALARALATQPQCLLLDEPISSLDTASRAQLRALLRALNRKGHSMLHVTHDYEEAAFLATRVAIMDQGRIAHVGSPKEVFLHPKSEFVANFIGIRNLFRGRLHRPNGGTGLAQFITSGPVFAILTDEPAGPGFLMLRSEDVTVAGAPSETSARNSCEGTVLDLAPARLGIEVTVDVGVEISALITSESVDKLRLACGRKMWISFKASAARFMRE